MAEVNKPSNFNQNEHSELANNEDCCDAFAISAHPVFKLLAFWHSQHVLGIESVVHHA